MLQLTQNPTRIMLPEGPKPIFVKQQRGMVVNDGSHILYTPLSPIKHAICKLELIWSSSFYTSFKSTKHK